MDREHSQLCLSRCEPSSTEEEPRHSPCPGLRAQLTSTWLGAGPTEQSSAGWALWREKHQEQHRQEEPSPPLPSTQAVPKPGSGSGSPRQPWGTQGSSRPPEQAGQEHSEAEAAAWKDAHSGRMPSNKFIVFYYIFPFLHLIPIPHIQTLLSERK